MNKFLKSIFFFLIFILFITFAQAEKAFAQEDDPNPTRWMNSTLVGVNGIPAPAYDLGFPQTVVSTTNSQNAVGNLDLRWGIRVWRRTSAGAEVEITAGVPVAQVSRLAAAGIGSGMQNATWTPGVTALVITDSIVVRVYVRFGLGGWIQQAAFTTPRLGATQLNAAMWTVNYWTFRNLIGGMTFGELRWGNPGPGYNSRIENLAYTTPTVNIAIGAPASATIGVGFPVSLTYNQSAGQNGGIHLRWLDADFDITGMAGCGAEYIDDSVMDMSFAPGWEGIECSNIPNGTVKTFTLLPLTTGVKMLYYRAWDIYPTSPTYDCGGGRADYNRDPGTCSLNCDPFGFPGLWEECTAKSHTITINAANTIPDAIAVNDAPDPVTVGNGITFTGNWNEPDAGDNVKMYVCKNAACTNCNNVSQANCWCYSLLWNTQPDTTDTCIYTAQAADVGVRSYWLGVCDDQPSCDITPLGGGSFTVNAAPVFDFSLTVAPPSASVPQDGGTSPTVTATLTSGATQPVTLTYACPTCPASVTFAWPAGNVCSPTCSRNLGIDTSPTTAPGSYTITINGTGGAVVHSATFILTVSSSCTVSFNQANYSLGDTVTLNFTNAPAGSNLNLKNPGGGIVQSWPVAGNGSRTYTLLATDPTGAWTVELAGPGCSVSNTANVTTLACTAAFNQASYILGDTMTLDYTNAPPGSTLTLKNPSGAVIQSWAVSGTGSQAYTLLATDPIGTWKVVLAGASCNVEDTATITALACTVTFDQVSYNIGDTMSMGYVDAPPGSNLTLFNANGVVVQGWAVVGIGNQTYVLLPADPPGTWRVTLAGPSCSVEDTATVNPVGLGENLCHDGLDDDLDGLIDCNDPDCDRGITGSCPQDDATCCQCPPQTCQDLLELIGGKTYLVPPVPSPLWGKTCENINDDPMVVYAPEISFADINKDGKIDAKDFAIADVSKDWKIDSLDLAKVSKACRDRDACVAMRNDTSNSCDHMCADFMSRIKSAFGKKCFDSGYDPVADVDKNGIVNINDLTPVAQCGNDATCCYPKWDKADPCKYCDELQNRMTAAWGERCFQTGYDLLADLDKNGVINVLDTAKFGKCGGNEDCCKKLFDYSDPCNYCQDLTDKLTASWNKTCTDVGYQPIADINKDQKVNAIDLATIGKCGGNQACCKKLWDPTSPCGEICNNFADDDGDTLKDCDDPDCAGDPACACSPNSCRDLLNLVVGSSGKDCFDPYYSKVADINKDKKINVIDVALASKMCGDGAACNAALNDPTNPCAATAVPGPDCEATGTCSCPANCECPLGECQGGLVPCGRKCDDPYTQICECCHCTFCHVFVLIKRVIDFLTLYILFPAAALAIVAGGVMFLTARGEPAQLTQGKNLLRTAIIGVIIILAAWLIVNTIIVFITPATSPFRAWHNINCSLTLTECNNGIDDDGDHLIDYPNDPQCEDAMDDDESGGATRPQCKDGLDNDRDAKVDYPDDPGCTDENDDSESTDGGPVLTCNDFTSQNSCQKAVDCYWCLRCSGFAVFKWFKETEAEGKCIDPGGEPYPVILCGYHCEYSPVAHCGAECESDGECTPSKGGLHCIGCNCQAAPRDVCLEEGSLILTPEGYKNIEELKEGDFVIGFKDGKEIESKILEKSIHEGEFELYFYKNYWFTGNHLVYLDDYKKFKPVSEFSNIKTQYKGKVYNIQTETENYFGENGLLIHNK